MSTPPIPALPPFSPSSSRHFRSITPAHNLGQTESFLMTPPPLPLRTITTVKLWLASVPEDCSAEEQARLLADFKSPPKLPDNTPENIRNAYEAFIAKLEEVITSQKFSKIGALKTLATEVSALFDRAFPSSKSSTPVSLVRASSLTPSSGVRNLTANGE